MREHVQPYCVRHSRHSVLAPDNSNRANPPGEKLDFTYTHPFPNIPFDLVP